MKKIIFNLFLISTFFLGSCESEISPSIESNFQKDIPSHFGLAREFPDYFSKIDPDSFQKILVKIDKDFYLDDFEVVIYTAKENNEIVGYLLESNLFNVYTEISSETVFNSIDLETGNFVEFENKRKGNDFVLYDITNDVLIAMENTNHSSNRSGGCQGALIICTAGCTLGTIGIGASDGPLPIMDIVAAAFYISCNAGCVNTYNDCMAANPETGME